MLDQATDVTALAVVKGPLVRRLVALSACLTFSACSGSAAVPVSRSSPGPVPAPSATASLPPTAGGPSPTPTSSVPPSLTSDARPLGVRMTVVQGRHGRISYRLALPVFFGPQADLVNGRVRRSADGVVTSVTSDLLPDVADDIGGAGVVSVNDGRSVQVRLPFLSYARGAAHPIDAVSTVALRRVDAQPLLLTDVFRDSARALAVALQHASEVAVEQGQDNPAEFLTTKVSDWANWQSGPTGITFFFDDYAAGSHATGLRLVEVPWALLRPYVRDDAYLLLGPR